MAQPLTWVRADGTSDSRGFTLKVREDPDEPRPGADPDEDDDDEEAGFPTVAAVGVLVVAALGGGAYYLATRKPDGSE